MVDGEYVGTTDGAFVSKIEGFEDGSKVGIKVGMEVGNVGV